MNVFFVSSRLQKKCDNFDFPGISYNKIINSMLQCNSGINNVFNYYHRFVFQILVPSDEFLYFTR